MWQRLLNLLPPALRCYCSFGHALWLAVLIAVFLIWGHGA